MPDEIPPPPLPPEPPADAPSPSAGTGLPPNVAAGIACVFPLVGGIVFLMLEKRDAFVRFHAMESVVFNAMMVVAQIVLAVASFVAWHIPLLGLVVLFVIGLIQIVIWLLWLVVYVVQVVKAFSGAEWEIPYVAPIAREQLARGHF